ncbi:MAG: UDP-N-acetylglucosamine 1-carboxyvinyltransferase [Planctomycetota bacterium]
MDRFIIEGGSPLRGTTRVRGSKNASLPLLAAALLTEGPVSLRGVPDLADTRNMRRLLEAIGCELTAEAGSVVVRAGAGASPHAPYEIVRTMRASICVLGPLLARFGRARVALPGGCAIGPRPVDLHLKGLEALGAAITLDSGDVVAEAPRGRLRGATVFLGGAMGSTVLGTANVMCAATLAEGVTVIESAACEPEIVDLARLLSSMGARVSGAGSPRITVEGVDLLEGADHTVIPDRIEAGTLMAAAAATRGDVTLENCPIDTMLAFTVKLREIGVTLDIKDDSDPLRSTVRVCLDERPGPTEITTQPHPGFPTDLQAQTMALLTLADGHSVITEKIFPERFLHVAELGRMGAKIFRQGGSAVVSGEQRLIGAPVMASDLRASAGLVIAGLAAEGTTIVNRVYHIDRGYQRLEETLVSLNARIQRTEDSS